MTLPSAPNIGTTGVVQQPGIAEALAPLLHALEQRQKLDLARKELVQRQQEFELRLKVMGPEIEGQKLANEKSKRDMKAQDDDLVARDQALQLYTGNLPQLANPQGVGEVIARIKDPKVAAHFYELLKDGIGISTSLTPPSQVVPTGAGTYGLINTRDATTRQTNLTVPPDASSRRIPVVTEREKASAAVNTIRANVAINERERLDPTIGARVANKVAVRKSIVSGLMRRLVGTSQEDANLLAESEIEKSMTPEELEYYVAGKQLLSGILPGLSGKQVTAREYVMHAPAYLSMGSTSPAVIASRRRARASRIRGFAAEAGDAMAERLAELEDVDLSEYGLGVAPDGAVKTRRAENPY